MASRRADRVARLALLSYGIVLAGASSWRLVDVSLMQLAAPFDLISEGPHLTTVQAIREGYNIYAPALFFSAMAVITVVGAETSALRVALTAFLCVMAVASKQPFVVGGAWFSSPTG